LEPISWQYSGVPAYGNGHLDQIPVSLLTSENLLKVPDDGKNLVFDKYKGKPRVNKSALHFAAEWAHLDQVPKDVLTVDNLLAETSDEVTPLELAQRFAGGLDALVGMDFGNNPRAREILTREWWDMNQSVLHERSALLELTETAEVELF